MKLLILNYSMNESSLLFSHQRVVAQRLSEEFEETHVITADEELGAKTQGLYVTSTGWKPNKRLKSVIEFYKATVPLILKNRRSLVIFSHMTEVQSFLIAPWCRIFQIPHYLWYAHASRSFFLYGSSPFLNGIITSTPGSCPLKGKKVFPIGQAIDEQNLKGDFSKIKSPPLDWYHVGRIDSSKKIDLIIAVFVRLRAMGWNLKLDIYGAPSTEKSNNYLALLLNNFQTEITSSWLSFKGPIGRQQLFPIANQHDGFVHAFQGSLDKAVLEATLSKRIVASINPEFIREFDSKEYLGGNLEENLFNQVSQFLHLTPTAIRSAIESNYEIAKKNHTLERWLVELCRILKNGK